jgi:hypothetical protein
VLGNGGSRRCQWKVNERANLSKYPATPSLSLCTNDMRPYVAPRVKLSLWKRQRQRPPNLLPQHFQFASQTLPLPLSPDYHCPCLSQVLAIPIPTPTPIPIPVSMFLISLSQDVMRWYAFWNDTKGIVPPPAR